MSEAGGRVDLEPPACDDSLLAGGEASLGGAVFTGAGGSFTADLLETFERLFWFFLSIEASFGLLPEPVPDLFSSSFGSFFLEDKEALESCLEPERFILQAGSIEISF